MKEVERRNMSKKIFVAALLLIVFAIAAMIFLFSAQSGEESGRLSGHITEPLIRLIYRDYDQLSADEQSRIVQTAQFVVRKGAHFSEYALLGFFLCLLLRQCGCRRFGIWTWIAGTLYAGTDELHQLLGGTRTGSLRDVCIDSAGVLFGLCIVLAVLQWRRRSRAGKNI